MKYFELVTGSVTSFCITNFRKSLLQLENSEPHKFVILGKSQPSRIPQWEYIGKKKN